jgi:putative transposase
MPTANCFAERLALTVCTEPTDRTLIFGERHLPRLLIIFSAHYNMHRPHRALHLHPPRPPELICGTIRRRPVLGERINEYDTAA